MVRKFTGRDSQIINFGGCESSHLKMSRYLLSCVYDIDKDYVFCRCEKCRYIPRETWDLPSKDFNNVQEAVDFWNDKNE